MRTLDDEVPLWRVLGTPEHEEARAQKKLNVLGCSNPMDRMRNDLLKHKIGAVPFPDLPPDLVGAIRVVLPAYGGDGRELPPEALDSQTTDPMLTQEILDDFGAALTPGLAIDHVPRLDPDLFMLFWGYMTHYAGYLRDQEAAFSFLAAGISDQANRWESALILFLGNCLGADLKPLSAKERDAYLTLDPDLVELKEQARRAQALTLFIKNRVKSVDSILAYCSRLLTSRQSEEYESKNAPPISHRRTRLPKSWTP